mgnify:CR=1 FL=1
MICEIKTSSITQIEYIPSSDIERVSNLWPAENKVSVLTLKAGLGQRGEAEPVVNANSIAKLVVF